MLNIYFSSLLLVSTIMVSPVLAQDAPAETTGDAAGKGIGDIIVTAQRRSENLQRTPVSVSVVTAEALAKKNITTEADLQFATPGLIVRAGQNSNALNYAIRGESLDPFSNTRPGVLPYVNEVQVSSSGGSSAFYDLQSVQVLKGPQGTLFGRNSTGGAVLFTTTKPSNELTGYVSARLGNYDLRHFEAAINVPLVDDTILLRVAGISQHRDGFQVNQFDGKRLGNVKRDGIRGSLTLKPFEGFENTLVVDYLHSGGSPMSSVLYSLDPGGPIPVIAASAGVLPQFADINEFLATQKALGPYKPNVDGSTSFKSDNIVISNITAIDLGENTQLRNIFGYSNIDQALFSDTDGGPYQIDDNGIVGSVDANGKRDKNVQYTEELQLVGKTFGQRLAYTVGVYYAHERVTDFTTSRLLGILAASQDPVVTQYNTARTGGETYAIYGQGTYDLSDTTGVEGLGVTAGARYTSEKTLIRLLPPTATRPGDNSYLSPPAEQATFDFDQQFTYKNVSWTLGLQYQANPNLLLYTASRRGYRNGGFNGFVKPVPGLGTAGGNRYDEQRVTDAEIGAKFQGYAGGMPVRLNGAAYILWINNAQRAASVLVGGAPAAITVNVPKSKVQGVELDGQINPADWLSLGGSVNYTDAKNTDNLVSIAGAAPVQFGTYPDAPKWSGTAFAEVTVPVQGDITASFRGDMYAQKKTFFSGTGNIIPGTEIPGYALVNFRAGIQDESAGWSLSANLKNAFNEVYYVGGEALGALFQINMANPGDRRTISVEVRFKF